MEFVGKKYKMSSSENFDEFMKTIVYVKLIANLAKDEGSFRSNNKGRKLASSDSQKDKRPTAISNDPFISIMDRMRISRLAPIGCRLEPIVVK